MASFSYKCPNCDGELVFDPQIQKHKCPYCGSIFSMEEIADDTAQEEQREQAEAMGYHCPSCGAEVVTDSTTAATFCYYCHNPVVLTGRVSGKFLPDSVIPFRIDKKKAEESFLAFVQSKKFVPRAFFRKQQIEKLSGVYFPYWVYDCQLEGQMNAQATNIRVWRSGDTEYTETKYYRIEREGEVTLSGITKNALKKADHQLAQGVLPYQLGEKKEFHTGYLSGFLAEKRDVDRESLKNEVEREVRGYGNQLLRDTISGYSGVTVDSANYRPIQEKWSYVLLPVWTLTYKGRNGKMYYYTMNGQTGKVYGELPVDYRKIWLLGGMIGIIVLILCLIGGYLV